MHLLISVIILYPPSGGGGTRELGSWELELRKRRELGVGGAEGAPRSWSWELERRRRRELGVGGRRAAQLHRELGVGAASNSRVPPQLRPLVPLPLEM